MKRLNVDSAAPAVKKFLRSLSIDANGIEVELDGQRADFRALLQRSRQRSQGVAPEIIEQQIRDALATVRGKR